MAIPPPAVLQYPLPQCCNISHSLSQWVFPLPQSVGVAIPPSLTQWVLQYPPSLSLSVSGCCNTPLPQCCNTPLPQCCNIPVRECCNITPSSPSVRGCYNIPPLIFQGEFLDKNNDALHASLEQLIGVSQDTFIKTLFPEATHRSEVNTKKLALISVSSKFRVSQITMYLCHDDGSHFIRAIAMVASVPMP